jgi:hypothetical protein
MNKTEIEQMIERLHETKDEMRVTYLKHFTELIEIDAPDEVYEMLDSENDRIMKNIDLAIEKAKRMLTMV